MATMNKSEHAVDDLWIVTNKRLAEEVYALRTKLAKLEKVVCGCESCRRATDTKIIRNKPAWASGNKWKSWSWCQIPKIMLRATNERMISIDEDGSLLVDNMSESMADGIECLNIDIAIKIANLSRPKRRWLVERRRR